VADAGDAGETIAGKARAEPSASTSNGRTTLAEVKKFGVAMSTLLSLAMPEWGLEAALGDASRRLPSSDRARER